MAEKFHPFSDLPKELRLQIWEQAMIEARPERCIILYKLRVVPFKQSISPLLLVNYESRTCAKAFYNTKLDIFAIPPLADHQIKSVDKQKEWGRIPGIERAVDGKICGYTDLWVRRKFEMRRRDIGDDHASDDDHSEDCECVYGRTLSVKRQAHAVVNSEETKYTVDLEKHWAEYVEEQLRVFGLESAVKAEKSGPIKGAFYISLEHDVFIEGYECGRHFYIEDASKLFGADLEQRPACHHISARLDAATCKRVSTLVLVRPEDTIYDSHCVFADGMEIDYAGQPGAHLLNFGYDWRREAFPSVNTYLMLSPDCYNGTGFLKQMIEADGPKLSQVLERWVNKGSSLNPNGITLWKFERTGGFNHFYSAEQVDWARELMAHWD